MLRKAGFSQSEAAKFFGASQPQISTLENKYKNNGIPNDIKEMLVHAEKVSPEKMLEFLYLRDVVQRFGKEEKNDKCDRSVCPGVASDCFYYKEYTRIFGDDRTRSNSNRQSDAKDEGGQSDKKHSRHG